MRPRAGVDRLKPVPPMHANDLLVVGQALSRALSRANRIISQLLTVAARIGIAGTAANPNTMRKSKSLNPWGFCPNCAIRRCFYRSHLPQLTEIFDIRLWNLKCTR